MFSEVLTFPAQDFPGRWSIDDPGAKRLRMCWYDEMWKMWRVWYEREIWRSEEAGRPSGCFCKHPSTFAAQKHKMSNYINLIIAAKKPRNSKKLGAWGILKLVQVWQHLGLSFVKSRHALEWKVNGCTPTLISRAQPRKLTIQLIFRRVRPRQTSVSAKLPPFNGKNSRQRKVEIGRLRSISADLDLSLTKCSAAWGKTKPPVFLEFGEIMSPLQLQFINDEE